MFPSARDRRRFRWYVRAGVLSVLLAVSGGILSICSSVRVGSNFDEAYTEMRTVLQRVSDANLEEPADAKQWAESFLHIWLEAGAQNKEVLNQWISEPPPGLDLVTTGNRRVLTVEAVTVDRISGLWIVTLFTQTAYRNINLDNSVSYVAEPMSWWKVTVQKHPETERWWAMYAPRQVAPPTTEPQAPVGMLDVAVAIDSSADPRWEQNAIRWLENFLVENIGDDYAFDRLTHPEFKGVIDATGTAVGGVNDYFLRGHKYDRAEVVRLRMLSVDRQQRVCFCEARVEKDNGVTTVSVFPVALVLDDNTEPRVIGLGDQALQTAFATPQPAP